MERNSRKSLLLFAFNLLLCYPLQAQVSCWLSDSTNIVSLFDLKLDTVFSIFGEPDHIEREKVIQKFGKDTRGSDEALFYEKYKLAFLTRKHFEYAGYLETRHWIHKLYFEDCYVNSMVIQKGSPILVNNKKFKELKNQADLENLFRGYLIQSENNISIIHHQLSELIDLEFRFYLNEQKEIEKLIITEDL